MTLAAVWSVGICMCYAELKRVVSLLQGAFWGLMVGLTVGVVRMALDFVYPEPGCGEVDDRPLVVARIHYMYFALMLCVLTGITVIIISYAGKRPDPSKVGISTRYREMFITSHAEGGGRLCFRPVGEVCALPSPSS